MRNPAAMSSTAAATPVTASATRPYCVERTSSRTGLPKGAVTGFSDRKERNYHGPCPPIGRHRYFHKLYALDTTLPDQPLTKADLETAMKGHVMAEASLIGTYQKGDR